MKITEGIHQLQIPMRRNPLGKTYCYLLTNSRTLVDTGVPTNEGYNALVRQLKDFDLKTSDLQRIIITHLHNDHIGLVPKLHDQGVKVFASEQAVELEKKQFLEWEKLYENTYEEIRLFGGHNHLKFLSRFEYAFRGVPDSLPIDETLSDGEILDLDGEEFHIIWTPGHAWEHICIWSDQNRVLFSGDHILPRITSHVSMHTYQARDPLDEYLSSLKKVEKLPAEIILPGHEYNFHNLRQRVNELYEHHKSRLGEIKETLNDGPKTVFQVGSKVSWDSRPWNQMNFWTKRMAASETYAHLVYLKNKGEIIEEKVNNVLYYNLN